jgi:single-strand DNA-binding protein
MDIAMNIVVLVGSLSSLPTERTLPSGDTLLQLEVTTRTAGGTRSVPVVVFDPPRQLCRLAEGETVLVHGCVRRRFFRNGGATASRTEVVAEGVVAARHRKRFETALTRLRERFAHLDD